MYFEKVKRYAYVHTKAMIDSFLLRNPCKGIKIVRDEKKNIRVLTKEEHTEFFDCCKGTFYDNLFIVAISTGLRQGEICALTWEDIDLKNKEITLYEAGYILRLDCRKWEDGIKTTMNSQGSLDALAIDDPFEYVRLALDEEMQTWVNAMDDDSVW